MKPAAFDYLAADSLDAAAAALSRAGGDGKVLAGGQSLMPMLNFRLVRPSILIDINRIPGLAYIEATDNAVRVGALTRHHAIETSPVVKAHLPVLTAAMQHVAHLAIRNRGTIGGSLSHADPAAELPMMALLLDARIAIQSYGGRRTEQARDFFVGSLATSLGEDEIVTDVEFPRLAPGTGWAFEEVARRSGDFALAAVGVTISVRDGKADQVRIGMMGVGETPLRAPQAEALLSGRTVDGALLDEAVASVRSVVEPNSDLHASGEYRRHLVGVLARRAIETAWRRAIGDLQ
ncbi:MAG: xanthine dehydrogenase family protein subunit M [Hyphomicrobiaceae bacterium]|nr:MAG: xanthine dehydrogenase family protein subunit M [Hyphomicrobiaceae bacterium]